MVYKFIFVNDDLFSFVIKPITHRFRFLIFEIYLKEQNKRVLQRDAFIKLLWKKLVMQKLPSISASASVRRQSKTKQ